MEQLLYSFYISAIAQVSPEKAKEIWSSRQNQINILFQEGNFDEALEIVRELGEANEVEVVNSINPNRLEGQKTAAFEICDALGDAPDFHFLPVGNAGNITAYWKGYTEYQDAGEADTHPRMMGWQAAGAAPIADGKPVADPETIATAIRIGNPASWRSAKEAARDSGGRIDKVTDEEIVAAYQMLAKSDGIFVEPASAAAPFTSWTPSGRRPPPSRWPAPSPAVSAGAPRCGRWRRSEAPRCCRFRRIGNMEQS